MKYKSSISLSGRESRGDGKNVGVVFPGYGYERVCYALPVEKINYKQVYSLPIHRILKNNNFYKNTPIVFGHNIDLLHTWNAIPVSRHPFVVSFENELPRYFGKVPEWQKKLGYSLLNSDRCRGILAISDVAANLARNKMSEMGCTKIAEKIQVFRGGVNVESAIYISPGPSFEGKTTLKLLFVGGDAFPKGFVPAFTALEELVGNGASIHLTVIGGFKSGGYVLKGKSPDPLYWKNKIQNTEWVTHYDALPNKNVIENMKRCDLFLFPSYDESLGWAVIEAGLLGVPSITTNVFALPELVQHNMSGYVINLNLGHQNRWQGVWDNASGFEAELESANKAIYEGTKDAIIKIFQNPRLLGTWGRAAKVLLTALYGVDTAAQRLSVIYSDALKGWK